MAHHQMVVDEEGNLVAVGRLYINAENEASIRFMAVHPSVQDKAFGYADGDDAGVRRPSGGR